MNKRFGLLLIGLLASGLALVACGAPAPGTEAYTWSADLSPLPTPTNLPTPTVAPALAPTIEMLPGQLVVLHTNDNWGEVDPCG